MNTWVLGILIGFLGIVVIILIAVGISQIVFYKQNIIPPTSCENTREFFDTIVNKTQWSCIKAGPWIVSDLTTCVEGKEQTCYYQNPTSPYTVPNFFFTTYPTFKNLPLKTQVLASLFTLEPNQLCILYGPTPPDCLYWGFTMYLFNDPEKCNNKVLFASLADTVNNYNTNLPPNKPFCLVVGCNTETLDAFIDEAYNIIRLPFPYQGPEAQLQLLGRTAVFKNALAEQAYYEDTRSNVQIIQYYQDVDPLRTITEPYFAPRNSYYDEYDQIVQFNIASELYIEQVKRDFVEFPYIYPVPAILYPYEDGYVCINECAACNGDNRDTVYFSATPPYTLEANKQVVVVFGKNHSTTGKAAYTNLSLYNSENDSGIASVDFLPGTDFYQVLVVYEMYEKPTDTTDEIIIPSNVHNIIVAERAYVQTLAPGGRVSTRGISATPETIIPPLVWVLSKTMLTTTIPASTQ